MCNRRAAHKTTKAKPKTPCGGIIFPCPKTVVVQLTSSKSLLTLKHDRLASLQINVTITPSGSTASDYAIEIRRAFDSTWHELDRNASCTWDARIAGHFVLRASAKVDGFFHRSSEIKVEVQFPDYGQIVGDPTVVTMTDAAWTATEADATATPVNRRREQGLWIELDTTSNIYQSGPVVYGAWSGPTTGASVLLPPRPADRSATPRSIDTGAVYQVASFHTHTPTAFRNVPANFGASRGVGPSGGDNRADSTDQVPGVVYDYVGTGGSVPMGHPLGSPAQRYYSAGVIRRPTPP